VTPIYEDNHIIIVSKQSGEIVQGDKTGDTPLSETVKDYIKVKYQKPGNVFLGVVHRLDRPVSGLVMFARTSKALARLNEMFRVGDVHKTYWAIVQRPSKSPCIGGLPLGSGSPPMQGERGEGLGSEGTLLTHWLVRNEKQNKSYAYDHEVKDSKKAQLSYRILAHSDRYSLVEVQLYTGRHHQIRCQLSKIGYPIKGDLKYGSPRSNKDGSICLLSRHMEFVHPVSKETIRVTAPLPDDALWQAFGKILKNND
jgi:23S rRNA pseudouridine1911/1915/1917 synthase